jgi:predicted dehydrogenase
MTKKIKLGMIGGGEGSFIGAIHYKAAMLDGYYELVCGAFSSDAEKAVRSAAYYHVPAERAYKSWQQMFETEAALPADQRMEAVLIATPNHLHHPQAVMAVEKGFHVICDKPVTISLEQALDLEQKVLQSKLIFALTHTYTGYPMVKEARHMAASGKLGKIRKLVVEYPQGWLTTPLEKEGHKQASWRLDPRFSGPGGCLGDIGVHAENLAEYITGLSIEELCADITSFVPGRTLDDDASVLLRFNGGAKGILYASQISAGEENNLTIRVYGENGGLEWQHSDPNTLLLKMLDQPVQILRAGAGNSYLAEKTRWNLRTPGGHPEGYIEAFANIYRNAAYHINKHKNPDLDTPDFIEYPTISDGVRGMRFIEKVIQSSQSDIKWIRFDD